MGFRYTAYYAAQANNVTGWVRNLPDGSVEAEFEGTEGDIDRTVLDIQRGRFIGIDRMEVRKLPAEGDSMFIIR